MTRRHAALLGTLLASTPATAFAQAAPNTWSALAAGPILLACTPLLWGLGKGMASRSWHALSLALWALLMTAGGSLAVFVLQGAATGKLWQLPSLVAGFTVFVVAGHRALAQSPHARDERASVEAGDDLAS